MAEIERHNVFKEDGVAGGGGAGCEPATEGSCTDYGESEHRVGFTSPDLLYLECSEDFGSAWLGCL